MTKASISNRLSKTTFSLILSSAFVLLASHGMPAQTFTTLHDFTGGADGGAPAGVLTMDRAGNLYGTTPTGGNNGCSPRQSCGVVYKLTRRGSSWLFSTIYAFHGSDGATPLSGVIFGPDGALYGTTSEGGAAGAGVVFRLQPPATICQTVSCLWTETVLHSFAGSPQDGGGPGYGPLVFDHAGNIYGTTVGGGASSEGTVYELTHSSGGWMEKVLYNFGPPPDADQPQAGVTLDSAGNLYGTTEVGGRRNVGTVFELTPNGSGWSETILYSFTQDEATYNPIAGVIFDGSGNLYGVTYTGAAVYELSPAAGGWTYQVVYTLNAFEGPFENLTFDSAGDLLGAVYSGNPHVFRLTPSNGAWTLTGFDGNDGGHSLSNVLQDASGNFYATSSIGGAHSQGTVFQITP